VNNLGKYQPSPGKAEMIYSSQTNEEKIVRDILNQWGKGAHGFIPNEKEEDII
jgi:hypothetical protein